MPTMKHNQDVYLNGNNIATKATVLIDPDEDSLKVLTRSQVNTWDPILELSGVSQQAMVGDLNTYSGLRGTTESIVQWKRSSAGGCGCAGGR